MCKVKRIYLRTTIFFSTNIVCSKWILILTANHQKYSYNRIMQRDLHLNIVLLKWIILSKWNLYYQNNYSCMPIYVHIRKKYIYGLYFHKNVGSAICGYFTNSWILLHFFVYSQNLNIVLFMTNKKNDLNYIS